MARIENPETMIFSVRKAIQEEADRLKEEYIALAVQEYERQLRERIARSAIDVSSFYTISRHQTDLIITVKYE